MSWSCHYVYANQCRSVALDHTCWHSFYWLHLLLICRCPIWMCMHTPFMCSVCFGVKMVLGMVMGLWCLCSTTGWQYTCFVVYFGYYYNWYCNKLRMGGANTNHSGPAPTWQNLTMGENYASHGLTASDNYHPGLCKVQSGLTMPRQTWT